MYMIKKRLLGAAASLLGVLLLPGCVGLDFSPDGKQIIASTAKGLAIMNVDGTGLQLVAEGEKSWSPSWSPDGKHILFVKAQDEEGDLFLYDTQTRKSRKLGAEYEPTVGWREDGKKFADIHKTKDGHEAVFYDLTEGGINLKVSLGDVSPGSMNVIWLPNTDNIAFIGETNEIRNVYTIESGELKKITSTGDIIGLSLSADGKKLLWARKSANAKFIICTLYAYDLDKRSVSRLPFPERIIGLNSDMKRAPTSVEYVSFSPSGDWMTLLVGYSKADPKSSDDQTTACWVVRMDGSQARQVYKCPLHDSNSAMVLPVWSKNGNQLALMELEDKTIKIAIFRPDGTGGRRILDQKSE
jgi:Tol biopolymer transport system component